MKIGALVPARIGSKRLPRKNIKMLGGRPLVCWTVDTLLESGVFHSVTVSTESEEVAEVVRGCYSGEDVDILMRPEELAHDDAHLHSVMEHYLANRDCEYFGLFMPTYPFRRVDRLREAAYAIHSRYPWRVQSVTMRQYPSMDYFYPDESGGVKRVFRLHPMHCPVKTSTYTLAHRNCYANKWVQTGISSAERLYTLYVDDIENIDVDTAEDFHRAELAAQGKRPVPRAPVSTRFGDWMTITPQGADPDAFFRFIGEKRLADTGHPVLILGRAQPSLNFYTIMNTAVRLYYLDREASTCFQSEKVRKTGNSAYMPVHYLHDQHYRIMRVPNIPAGYEHRVWTEGAQREMGWPHGGFHSDCNGLYFGTEFGGEVLPEDRVIWREELSRQEFYVEPVEYV